MNHGKGARSSLIAGTSHRSGEVCCPWALIVDDDPIAGRATARMLRTNSKVIVRQASDLRAVHRLIKQARTSPCLVVLDYELGRGETGLMALRLLRSLGVGAPCAFLTGAPEKLRHALDAALGLGPVPVFARSAHALDDVSRWISGNALAQTG